MGTTKGEASARDRLLEAASELFYEDGIHTVGIERVIERAGVAKASLYATFGSKDALVRAYLEDRAQKRQARIRERIAQYDSARERILAIFDLLAETAARPTYRGCAFINASAEEPRGDSNVRKVSAASRAWMRDLFVELARDAGVDDSELLGKRLTLLYDGAIIGASMEHDPGAAIEARAMAELLLETHDHGAGKPKRSKRAR